MCPAQFVVYSSERKSQTRPKPALEYAGKDKQMYEERTHPGLVLARQGPRWGTPDEDNDGQGAIEQQPLRLLQAWARSL